MNKPRKTIEVKFLADKVNDFLLNSPDDKVIERQTMSILLEKVLYETNNYLGFGYLDKWEMSESKCGSSVGINREAHPENADKRFENTDDTRRYYFYRENK